MEDEDARHRREEAERRAKRKAAKEKASKSDASRKRKEHAARILSKHKSSAAPSSSKRPKPSPPPPPSGHTPSHFQNLFTQRAQGFQIDFRFRNAPPRPPVGPCFVGHSLDGVLVDRSKQYQSNAVEVQYVWKLHSESDLGVPLAPSAMDPKSYTRPAEETNTHHPKLHPDDLALLDWTGPMGDTAAVHLKQRQDQARASARLALVQGKGRIPKILLPQAPSLPTSSPAAAVTGKKAFSRVLDETMQSWMKKTTYLSNDYSRKVHDFKSLAQTKQQVAQDLEAQQQKLALRRSAQAISNSFTVVAMPPTHPTKKHLKPKRIMSVLPNVEQWGQSFTHVVMDKVTNLDLAVCDINKAFVAEVDQRASDNRMVCQVWVPPPKGWKDPITEEDEEKKEETKEEDEEKIDEKEKEKEENDKEKAVGDDNEKEEGEKEDKEKPADDDKKETLSEEQNEGDKDKETVDNKQKEMDKNVTTYHPVQQFNLNVMPLKEEDEPADTFALFMDPTKNVVSYIPLSSRVQLSTARPMKRRTLRKVARREPTEEDLAEQNEQLAEVDLDVAEKVLGGSATAAKSVGVDDAARRGSESFMTTGGGADNAATAKDSSDDDSDGLHDKMAVGKLGAAADSDDDSDDDEETFGGTTKTIVAD